MSQRSTIEWTDATWNPVTGCTKVSPGCAHCYAERIAERFRGQKAFPHGFEVTLRHDKLREPRRWRRARRVFVNSMSDLFHEKVPFWFVALVYQTMAACPQHTFMILTKRPERMLRFYREWWTPERGKRYRRGGRIRICKRLFLRNPGCSECRYQFLGCLYGRKKWSDDSTGPNFRIVKQRTFFGHESEGICDAFEWHPDAQGHGVAVEMNAGEISVREQDLTGPFPSPLKNVWLGVSAEDQKRLDERIPLLLELQAAVHFVSCEPLLGPIRLGETCADWGGLDWVIVGGETGPGHRPMNLDWARSLRDQCRRAGIPFFFKQSSGPRPGMGIELDGEVIQEFP